MALRAKTAAAAGAGKVDVTSVAMTPLAACMTDRGLNLIQVTDRSGRDCPGDWIVGRTSLFDIAPDLRPHAETLERALSGGEIKLDFMRAGLDKPQWIRADISVWRTQDMAPGGLVITMTDVTDLVSAVRKLEHSERRLAAAARLAEFRVYEVDYLDREVTWLGGANGEGVEHISFDELESNRWSVVHPMDRESVEKDYAAAMAAGQAFRGEYRHRLDATAWRALAAEEVRDESGRLTHLIGTSRDITRQKCAEAATLQARDEAAEANRAKSQFLATMSHEIRTPLNGVLGMAQALAADAPTPAQSEKLAVIQECGGALLAILNDLLDLSKIEAGKFDLEDGEIDLAILLPQVVLSFAAAAERNRVQLDFDPGDGGGVYRGDPVRVRQIVSNLVSNAIKFSEGGQVSVRARRCGGELVLEVADTGVGISPEAQARLFQDYAQAETSTFRRFGGTGLGLAICRQLAELMGGSIVVASEIGAGSTFTVTLPLVRDRDSTDAPPDPGDDLGCANIHLKVLAAEDNPVNQLVLKTLLQQVDIEPVFVSDGQAAIDAWRREPWDVILMDINLPIMDGVAATIAIRREEQASGRARVPIMALTGNAMSHQISEYRAAGMDGHIAKPIEAAKLFRNLEAVFADGD